MAKAVIDREKCKGCGLCVEACPQRLIQIDSRINKNGYLPAWLKDAERCVGCRLCAISCPDVAILVLGEV